METRTAFDRATAAHLLRRAGFGGRTMEVERARADGLEATVETLLESARAKGPEITAPTDDIVQLQSWWMARMLGGAAALRERVTLMWHGHFATSNTKLGDARLMHRQNALLRERGLGDFRELLHAVAKDPAMLLWLDGNQNKVGRPNENFAREVMELFGLGIGSGYTEADIREAARALSGWTVQRREFAFHAADHDDGEKTLFGRGGVFTGEDAIDRVLAHPACPRWVARRLLHTFCVHAPTEAQCAEWGAVLVEEEWHIDRTLARLFRSELFLGPASRRSKIAAPVELVVGAVRALQLDVRPVQAVRSAAIMGQSLFMPPTVKGWDGGSDWIHPGAWLARHNRFTDMVLASDAFSAERAYGADLERSEVVERVTDALLPDGVAPALRGVLEDAAQRSRSASGAARSVTALVLTAPEYHLV